MKVVCAGPVKTGTKSLNLALKLLGYSVYDFPEHFYYLNDEWMKVFKGHATKEDFRKMFENVDAAMDTPAYHYWKEISDAFPSAKIILTVRDDEERWLQSLIKQIHQIRSNKVFYFTMLFTPLGWKWMKFETVLERIMFGEEKFDFWSSEINELLYQHHYRRQVAYVKEYAPKDKLLIFNCKEGWEPLCSFLDVPVPEDVPFPHENAKGEVLDELIERHPLFLQLKWQLKIVLFSITILIGIGYYYFFT